MTFLFTFLLVYFNKKSFPNCSPITYFLIQLALNLSWTTVFFQLQLPVLALIMIILMIITEQKSLINLLIIFLFGS